MDGFFRSFSLGLICSFLGDAQRSHLATSVPLWVVLAICLGSQPRAWPSSIRRRCAQPGAWLFGLRLSNGIGASILLEGALFRPLKSTRLGLARQAAHRSIFATPRVFAAPPTLSGGEKAGGFGETPPGVFFSPG